MCMRCKIWPCQCQVRRSSASGSAGGPPPPPPGPPPQGPGHGPPPPPPPKHAATPAQPKPKSFYTPSPWAHQVTGPWAGLGIPITAGAAHAAAAAIPAGPPNATAAPPMPAITDGATDDAPRDGSAAATAAGFATDAAQTEVGTTAEAAPQKTAAEDATTPQDLAAAVITGLGTPLAALGPHRAPPVNSGATAGPLRRWSRAARDTLDGEVQQLAERLEEMNARLEEANVRLAAMEQHHYHLRARAY